MRIGILADIHESLTNLRWAIDVLHEQGADRLVVLGDVFELGHRLKETVDLLADAGAIGVWGNHDFGLCRDNARPEDRERYGERVLAFMGSLQPRMEVDGCLFAHVEPWLDPEKIEDLWYFEGLPETTERVARSFAAVPNDAIVSATVPSTLRCVKASEHTQWTSVHAPGACQNPRRPNVSRTSSRTCGGRSIGLG